MLAKRPMDSTEGGVVMTSEAAVVPVAVTGRVVVAVTSANVSVGFGEVGKIRGTEKARTRSNSIPKTLRPAVNQVVRFLFAIACCDRG